MTKERLDRGKDFLHSENQLEEVYAALSKYLGERQQANKVKFPPLSPRRRRPRPVTQEMEAGIAEPAVGSHVTPAAVSTIMGVQDSRGPRLRMTAPSKSDMAMKFEQVVMNDDPVDEDVMMSLAIDLSETPVIWHKGKHYSIFLPKISIPGAPEFDSSDSIRPFSRECALYESST